MILAGLGRLQVSLARSSLSVCPRHSERADEREVYIGIDHVVYIKMKETEEETEIRERRDHS